MDGLSAAASVVAVLQLSSEVVGYIATVIGATKEWTRLSIEILGCKLVLQQIKDNGTCEGADQDWNDKIKALEAPNGPLARLSKALGFVKQKIEPGSGFRKALSAVKWPFTAKEVEKMIATIEREKSLLNLALTSNCWRLIQDIKQESKQSEERLSSLLKQLDVSSDNILQSVHDHGAEANAGIAELKGHNDDRQRLEILGWLSSSNYPAQQNDFIRRREPETGTWLLQSTEYQAWVATDSGQTLFCPGMPGAGKTMLTSIVIDHLTTKFGSDRDIAIAYIFYNFRRTKEETAEYVIMSLLKQLVQQRSTVPDGVRQIFKQHSDKATRPSLDEASSIFKSVAGMFSTIFVLVDALDEADRACWSKLIPVISSIQSTHKVNIFATSRFIPEITKKFSGVPSLEIRASTQDVERYLEGQMQQLQAYEDWTPRLQDEIKTVISNAVGGMFLLATIYLAALDDKTTPREVRRTLAQFQQQAPGSTEAQKREVLDQAYYQAMERITGQKQGFRTLALRALAWITFAKRPLTPFELQHALAVEPGDTEFDEGDLPKIERIISVCAGLVTFDSETRDIRLAHYTTQDYFQATWRRWFSSAHDDLTTTLITYLSFDGLRSGILKCADFYDYLGSTPSLAFYVYASENWGHHARESVNSDQTIIEFLSGSMAAYNLAIHECIGDRFVEFRGDIAIPSITGLHVAAWFGLEKVAEALLGFHDVNSRDGSDRTPLWYATHKGQSDCMGILLQRGADPNAKDRWGETSLHIAAERGVISVMSLLLRHGADVKAKDRVGTTPLHHAVIRSPSSTAMLCLLESGADIEATDNHGYTPLFQAVRGNNTNVTALLLDKGANIEAVSRYDETPLVVSVHCGSLDAFRLLLDRGANIRATDRAGCTILGLAAHRGWGLSEGNINREMVELLIKRGGLTGHNWGMNPHEDPYSFHQCMCLDTAMYLLERAAIVESSGADVWKPIGMGAPKGWLDAVQILIERGHTGGPRIGDLKRKLRNLRDLLELFGKKVLDIARDLSRGKTKARRDITQLLLETGADVEVGFSSWVMAEWYRYFMILLLEGLGELRGLSERELQELWNLERLGKLEELERLREYRERREYEDDYKLFSLALETFYLGHKELVELEEEYLDLSTRFRLVRGWLKSARPVRERRASF